MCTYCILGTICNLNNTLNNKQTISYISSEKVFYFVVQWAIINTDIHN